MVKTVWKTQDFAKKIVGRMVCVQKDINGIEWPCSIQAVKMLKDGSIKLKVGSKNTKEFDHVIHILDKYCFHYSNTLIPGTEMFPVDVIFNYGRILNSTSIADFRKGVVNFGDALQSVWINILKTNKEFVPSEYEAVKQEEYTRYFQSLCKTKDGQFALDSLRKVLADPRLMQNSAIDIKTK